MAVDKNRGCPSREPEFDSQQPHSGLQPNVTPVLEKVVPLRAFSDTRYMYTQAGKTLKSSTKKAKVRAGEMSQ